MKVSSRDAALSWQGICSLTPWNLLLGYSVDQYHLKSQSATTGDYGSPPQPVNKLFLLSKPCPAVCVAIPSFTRDSRLPSELLCRLTVASGNSIEYTQTANCVTHTCAAEKQVEMSWLHHAHYEGAEVNTVINSFGAQNDYLKTDAGH